MKLAIAFQFTYCTSSILNISSEVIRNIIFQKSLVISIDSSGLDVLFTLRRLKIATTKSRRGQNSSFLLGRMVAGLKTAEEPSLWEKTRASKGIKMLTNLLSNSKAIDTSSNLQHIFAAQRCNQAAYISTLKIVAWIMDRSFGASKTSRQIMVIMQPRGLTFSQNHQVWS